jgi:fumarylacetoacetase
VSGPDGPDASNDPGARSWVASANRSGGDFPLQNLPFAVFRRAGSREAFRGGIAIGDEVLDLGATAQRRIFDGAAARGAEAAAQTTLNALMAAGPAAWSALRNAVFTGLRSGSSSRAVLEGCLVPQADAEYALPAQIGDYTDFYTSIHHASAVGRMFRPDNPLLPNYKWVPVGYHGRSSSIVVSGEAVRRPRGQQLSTGATTPHVAASRRLDYEVELGVFIGAGNRRGVAVPLDEAEEHVFGMCLLNDWSARDLQAWEYQPLGPFLAKNFATSISPWVVTLQALAPFRLPFSRPDDDPQPLPYLESARNRATGAIDIRLEAHLDSAAMRARGESPQRLSSSSFRHSYWTVAQLLAHHTINGCDLRPGDLLGTGTQSGPTAAEAGSLLELSAGGTRQIALGTETRTFLEDGDTVTLTGWCEKPGAVRIGFGCVTGTVVSDLDLPGDLHHVLGRQVETIHDLDRIAVEKGE